MPRKPLRSQLNQVRAWVRQGRTDAWIAHQLDVPATELKEFRRRHGLEADGEDPGELDLRDEIEAEIEAATLEEAEAEEARAAEEALARRRPARTRTTTAPNRATEKTRRTRGTGPSPSAAPTTPRRARRQAPRSRPSGKLRPRRGRRLWPLAGPGGRRGSDLLRALGRQAPQVEVTIDPDRIVIDLPVSDSATASGRPDAVRPRLLVLLLASPGVLRDAAQVGHEVLQGAQLVRGSLRRRGACASTRS